MAFSQGAADVGLGLVLLVSAGALASGAFDVGTLALFVAYLGWLSFLPRMVGRVLARRKQAASPSTACASSSPAATPPTPCGRAMLPLERRQRGVRPADRPPDAGAAAAPRGRGLTARYPGGAGVHDVSFSDATVASSSS